MKAITITKIASHLYRNDYYNQLRFAIDKATHGKHPKDTVVLKDYFNSVELDEIHRLSSKLFFTKSVQEWRKIAKKLEYVPNLRDVIKTFTTKAALNKIINVPFSLEEMEQLDKIGI